MTTFTSRAFLAAALAGLAFAQFAAPTANAADFSDSRCDISQIASPTLFPNSAQQRGEHGIVRARVHVDANGLVQDAAVLDSSGHPTLDRAALESIRKYWRFAVVNCSAADLAADRIVTVRFEHAKYPTVSNTVSIAAVAKINELRADARCTANAVDSGTTVFSCINGGTRDGAIAKASQTAAR